jgi:hydroxymethylpyrimidine pyrophosphatase-like HAD family hydrolase
LWQMRVVNLDLDNTLIYSYKHDIGNRKMNVERYQGREISFMTEKTHELLRQIKSRCLVVPTTTRTKEQYDRIDLKAGAFQYALVCNGGVLLVNGQKDYAWHEESRRIISDCAGELRRGAELLKCEPLRKFELRFIEELFLFTKCSEPQRVTASLRTALDSRKVDVFHNGEKVYVVPGKLNKGAAVERFRRYVGADEVIAAGDSEFDMSMAERADVGIVPAGFCKRYGADSALEEMKGESIFSEEMLSRIKELIDL